MPENDLLIMGVNQVVYAIKSRHPHLSEEEAHKASYLVLDEVAKRIGSGESLAFFRLDERGRAEVITLGLERIPKDR